MGSQDFRRTGSFSASPDALPECSGHPHPEPLEDCFFPEQKTVLFLLPFRWKDRDQSLWHPPRQEIPPVFFLKTVLPWSAQLPEEVSAGSPGCRLRVTTRTRPVPVRAAAPSGKCRRLPPYSGCRAMRQAFPKVPLFPAGFPGGKRGKEAARSGCLYPAAAAAWNPSFVMPISSRNGPPGILRPGIKDMAELPESQSTGHSSPRTLASPCREWRRSQPQ